MSLWAVPLKLPPVSAHLTSLPALAVRCARRLQRVGDAIAGQGRAVELHRAQVCGAKVDGVGHALVLREIAGKLIGAHALRHTHIDAESAALLAVFGPKPGPRKGLSQPIMNVALHACIGAEQAEETR